MSAPRVGVLGVLTSPGDTLYLDGSSNLERLPVGADGQVLTLAGGVPTWAAPSSAATLQSAYDNGQTIVATQALGPIEISGDGAPAMTTALMTMDATNALEGLSITKAAVDPQTDVAIRLNATTTNVIAAHDAVAVDTQGAALFLRGGYGNGTGDGGPLAAQGGRGDSAGTGNGGTISLSGGIASPTGIGGLALLAGGLGGSTSGDGGPATVNGGNALGSGNGGQAQLFAGNGAGAAGNGANVVINGGTGSGTGTNGFVEVNQVAPFDPTLQITGDADPVGTLSAGPLHFVTTQAPWVTRISGSSNGAGNQGTTFQFLAGAGETTGDGGALIFVGGAGDTAGSGDGGTAIVSGGTGGATGNGGDTALNGGQGGATSGNGGNASVLGGGANGSGNGGLAIVSGGNGAGAAGNGANVVINGGTGAGTGTNGFVEVNAVAPENQALQITGDALLADVTAPGPLHFETTQAPWITRISTGTNGPGQQGTSVQFVLGNGETTGLGGALSLVAGSGDQAGGGSGNGGTALLLAGNGPGGTGNGGSAAVGGGTGGAVGGNGGNGTVGGGNAGPTGDGGEGRVVGGQATTGNGGDVILTPGDSATLGNGGNVIMSGGSPAGGGNNGFVSVTNTAFQFAQLDDAAEAALVGMVEGATIWNTTDSEHHYWDGANWVPFAGGAVSLTLGCDATDPVFVGVDLGAGAVTNPVATSAGTHSVLEYVNTGTRAIPWQRFMPVSYDSAANLTLSLYWAQSGAGAGNVVWAAAIENLGAGENILTDGFAALVSAAPAAAPAVAGQVVQTDITLTNAQADAIAAGEPFRIAIQRTPGGGDTLGESVYLVRAVLSQG